MKKMMTTIVTSIAIFGLTVSCSGKKSSGSSDKPQRQLAEEQESGTDEVENEVEQPSETPAADGSNIQGQYLAKLKTLNAQVNGTVPSSATFLRDGDKVMIYTRLFAGAPGVWHQQGIYSGTRCPVPADDLNADGYIDMEEGNKVWGQLLIPLDNDPGSQTSGARSFPVGDLSGYYHYERVTSFSRMFNDLKAEDKNPNDNIMKLAPDEPLELVGKVVVIQGTANTVVYPPTVATLNRYQVFQTLPIACGIFGKVSEVPGVPDDGNIPGPVAEPNPAEDQPAPPGAGETSWSTGGTVGEAPAPSPGAHTNESDRGESETSERSGDDEEENDEDESDSNFRDF